MELNCEQLQQLNDFYEEQLETNAIFLTGSKGLGKTSVIRNFLNKKKNVLYITCYEKNTFVLEPIISAINQFYMFQNDDCVLDNSSGLNMTDRINMELIKICSSNRIIFYFENITNYEEDLFIYVRKLLSLFINHYKNSNIFFIFDIDTDDTTNMMLNQHLQHLYSISPKFEYISFLPHTSIVIKQYFKSIFHNKIDINETDLDYILSSSSGNLSYLNMIVNFLKQTRIIIHHKTGYVCSKIEHGSLGHVLRDSIITRYNLLTDEMKQLLAQSSIIGITFDTNMLSNNFNILKADEILKIIEGISNLIFEEKTFLYRFENYEIYNIILQKIEPTQRKQWNKLLAVYYEKQYHQNFNGQNKIENLYKTAFHYKESFLFDKSIYYFILLIKMEIKVIDYKQAIRYIQDLKRIILFENKKKQHMLEAVITVYEGECYKLLGEYDKAVKCYQNCLGLYKNFYSEIELANINLNLSYSLYMNDNLPEALKIALKMKETLFMNKSEKVLLYKTISFLSSIFHLMGENVQAEEYYVGALTHCKENGLEEEYYVQLKKASMIFDIEIAEPFVREAATYFEKHNKIGHLAETLHNLSTDNLYLLKFDFFNDECQRSIKLFNQYGSILVHYPLNTMGVYVAAIKQDIDSAISIFEELLNYNIESFSYATIHTNLATCYRCKNNFEKCLYHIKIADSLISQTENDDIILLQTYHYINNALFHKAKGDLHISLSIFEECLQSVKLQSRHYFMINSYMKDIYIQLNNPIPADVESGCKIVTHPFVALCAKHDMFFATMRFYE